MPEIKEQSTVNLLLKQLHEKLLQYKESLSADEIFEVRKQIRMQIKELEKEISAELEKGGLKREES